MSGYELTHGSALTVVSAALLLLLSVLLWRRRELRGALPLAIQALLAAVLCLFLAAETAASGDEARRLWFIARSALILPSGLTVLWFALEYASLDRWLSRPVVAVLLGWVALQLALYLPGGGALIWSELWWDGEVRGTLAPLGAVFTASAFAAFVFATSVLVVLFARSPAHRGPVALILAGQVAVRLIYPLATLKLVELPNAANVLILDFAGLMYAIAVLRLRLFDLLPVARETILARMPDGLLILDVGDRIADINQAALRLLGSERSKVLGEPAAAAFAAMPELGQAVIDASPSSEATVDTAGGRLVYEVSSTSLSDWQGGSIGRLVLLHGITALRRVEAQLVEQERALAAAAERERLARELHDGLAQDLWLAKLKATRLALQPELDPEARALTDEITAAVDVGIAEARRAVATLRSRSTANGYLRELLSRALEDFEDRFGLPVEFDCAHELAPLESRAEAETLRIVQEALTNVRRHADATTVRVRAGVDDGHLVVEVQDNGRGFDPRSVSEGTFGLAGMRERAAQIGAAIEIQSAPGRGTRVHLGVPVASPAMGDPGLS